jgi:hypothetical protein
MFKNLTHYDFRHFLQLILHFTLKFLIFFLNFLTNHMFKDIYNVATLALGLRPRQGVAR